jgi:hypothetical protein
MCVCGFFAVANSAEWPEYKKSTCPSEQASAVAGILSKSTIKKRLQLQYHDKYNVTNTDFKTYIAPYMSSTELTAEELNQITTDNTTMMNISKSLIAQQKFQQDVESWAIYSTPTSSYSCNKYDTKPLKTKLYQEVCGDTVAEKAMTLFLNSAFWEFVDYYAENLNVIQQHNKDRFMEILILLTPGLYAEKYIDKAISIVGNKYDITQKRINDVKFCADMFFHNTVENAKSGKIALACMCENAFTALRKNFSNKELLDGYDLHFTAFQGTIFCDWNLINYKITSIWPNWK